MSSQRDFGTAPILYNRQQGLALRHPLLAGNLSPQTVQALIDHGELRQGLLTYPVPEGLRRAIQSFPNPSLRGLLLDELARQNKQPQPQAPSMGGTPIRTPQPPAESAPTTTEPPKSTGPVKHTMKRTNVPERPSLTDVINSSSISRAPFTGAGSFRSAFTSNSPIVICDNFPSPRSDPNTISDILRDTTKAQNLKRKRSEVGDNVGPNRTESRPTPATSNSAATSIPTSTQQSPSGIRGLFDSAARGLSNFANFSSAKPSIETPQASTMPPPLPDDDEISDDDFDMTNATIARPPHSSLTAENGRPYIMWRQSNGTEISTGGSLLPTGYRPLKNEYPENPWVCPVRSCRRLFPKISSLGHHFVKGHRAKNLNDNCDGTLSVVSAREGSGPLGAVIISKQPLAPGAGETLAAPQPPAQIYKRTDSPGQGLTTPSSRPMLHTLSARTQPTQVEVALEKHMMDAVNMTLHPHTPETRDMAMSNWRIIHPYLKSTQYSDVPLKGYVPDLLPLPIVRKVQFNLHSNPYFEKMNQDIAALIIQMTGSEPDKACQRCREGKGPFHGCVVLSTDAPINVRERITSCANCFYKGNQTYCDLNRWTRAKYSNIFETHPTTGAGRPTLSSYDSDGPGGLSAIKPVSRNGPSVNSPSPAIANDRQRRSNRDGLRQSTARNGNSPYVYTSGSNDAKPEDTLDMEMEEWEMAPGRIRNESNKGNENLAFSTTYLTHGEEVKVAPYVSFHVLVVKPGTQHRWEATQSKMRSCSITAGKISVKLGGQEFEVGTDGLIIIKAGMSCVVKNRHYADAKLHVTAISEPDDI